RALVAKIDAAMRTAHAGYQQVAAMRMALEAIKVTDSTSDLAKGITAFHAKLDSVGGVAVEDRPFSFGFSGTPKTDLFSVHDRLPNQFMSQDTGDLAPTVSALEGFALTCRDLTRTLARWKALNGDEVKALNSRLVAGGQKAITTAPGVPAPTC